MFEESFVYIASSLYAFLVDGKDFVDQPLVIWDWISPAAFFIILLFPGYQKIAALTAMEDDLKEFLDDKIKAKEDMSLLLSFKPLVEALLKNTQTEEDEANSHYCLVAERARLKSEKSKGISGQSPDRSYGSRSCALFPWRSFQYIHLFWCGSGFWNIRCSDGKYSSRKFSHSSFDRRAVCRYLRIGRQTKRA